MDGREKALWNGLASNKTPARRATSSARQQRPFQPSSRRSEGLCDGAEKSCTSAAIGDGARGPNEKDNGTRKYASVCCTWVSAFCH